MVVLLVYVNDFCYYRNCLYTHMYKFSKKKKGKESQIYSFILRNQLGFANRVGPGIGA